VLLQRLPLDAPYLYNKEIPKQFGKSHFTAPHANNRDIGYNCFAVRTKIRQKRPSGWP